MFFRLCQLLNVIARVTEIQPPNKGVALDRAGITVFRDITFLAAGPASERSRL